MDLINNEEINPMKDVVSNEMLNEYVSKTELQETKSEFVEQIKGFFKIQGKCTLEELDSKPKIEGHWWRQRICMEW